VAALASSAHAGFTLADLERLPADGSRHELLDGMLLVAPPPSQEHNRAGRVLARLLEAAAGSRYEVFEAAQGVIFPDGSVLVPDVCLVDVHRADPAAHYLPAGAVVLVAEVISPATRTTDRTAKAEKYAVGGIEHYWQVDPRQPAVRALRLIGGAYREVAARTGDQPLVVTEPLALTVVPSLLVKRPGAR
jgi:Uma2 family endonuclease